jgi:hypothetical protein
MDLIELRILGVLGIAVVALVSAVGAAAASLLTAGAVQAGLAVAGWLGRIRSGATEVRERVVETAKTRPADGNFRLDAADHALLARQAWWRLRC